MEEFRRWLAGAPASVESALEAHLRLVSIHPFSDGNGRTARLLMNLLLLKAGYPPLVVRPEDRPDYLEAIEKHQLHDDASDYQTFMLRRLDASLDDYLRFLESSHGP
jgi:Fic family protein